MGPFHRHDLYNDTDLAPVPTVGQAFVPAAAFQAAGLPTNALFWQTFTQQI